MADNDRIDGSGHHRNHLQHGASQRGIASDQHAAARLFRPRRLQLISYLDNMRRKALTALIFAGICLAGCRDDRQSAAIRKERQSAVNAIASNNFYDGVYANFTHDTTEQWKNYEKLTRTATPAELVELCEHKNPVVRCYAFRALVETCHPAIYSILLAHLSDTATFSRAAGCFIIDEQVFTLFLEDADYFGESFARFILAEEQRRHIDSMLIFSRAMELRNLPKGVFLNRACGQALKRLKPLPGLHERVRQLAKDTLPQALPLLAQYRDPADTPIFKALLPLSDYETNVPFLQRYVRKAIAIFPHPAFYRALKQQMLDEVGTNAISSWGDSYPLYAALAAYPSMETRTAFETALKRSRDEYKTRALFIYTAVREHPSKELAGIVRKPAGMSGFH